MTPERLEEFGRLLREYTATEHGKRSRLHNEISRFVFDNLPEFLALLDRIKRQQEALENIEQLCLAYPVSFFPEPDFKKAAEILKAGGMSLDAISASNMRHVLKGISQITLEALDTPAAHTQKER